MEDLAMYLMDDMQSFKDLSNQRGRNGFSSDSHNMSFIFGRVHSHIEAKIITNDLSGCFAAFKEFNEVLSDATFPCLFGRRAWKDKTNKFLFCDRIENGGLEHFRRGLIEYTEFVANTDIKDRLFSPLVVFVEGLLDTSEAHHLVAWKLLQYLIDTDQKSWPDNVPLDQDNPLWSFCFNDMQLFFNISTPAHKVLRSRRLSSCLTFVVNPRENFDVIANSQEKSGQLIRQKIRERVSEYNGGFVPSELGFFGDNDNFEWKQFQLGEPGLPGPLKCPLHMKNKDKDRY